MTKPLEKIIKSYPKRGPLSQFRFEKIVSYVCFRCNRTKTSKLISICNDNWELKLCNGCYGRLISLYEIHTGKDNEEEKIEKIVENIFNTQKQFSESLNILIENYTKKNSQLNELTIKYLATADFLGKKLPKDNFIEWSPAIMCLCKSVESELISKIFLPLKKIALENSYKSNFEDKRTIRIEKFVSGNTDVSPELGTISFLFNLLANSEEWKKNNKLFNIIKIFLEKKPFSEWFYSKNGASKSLDELCKKYRNISAHISDLTKDDFDKCYLIVNGKDGILEKIFLASSSNK